MSEQDESRGGADDQAVVPAPELTPPDASTPDQADSAPADPTPVAPVPEAPAVAAPAAPKKHWWQHAWAIFGVAVGVVGAITGVISIVPILVRDATDPESLTVSVEPADSEFAPAFAVPLLADWSSFPGATQGCSPEQLAWLEAIGTPLHERYLVTVGNSAQEGATMSLAKFRGEGETGDPATAVVVVCDRTGAGSGAMRAARLDPATGAGAVYAQADPSLPTNPLVFNLAPGESGEFALLVQSSAGFTGDLVFTASVGEQTWQEVLPVEGGLDVPGVAEQRLAVVDGALVCVGDAECDPSAVLSELAIAAGIA